MRLAEPDPALQDNDGGVYLGDAWIDVVYFRDGIGLGFFFERGDLPDDPWYLSPLRAVEVPEVRENNLVET